MATGRGLSRVSHQELRLKRTFRQSSASVSPSAILKELPVTLAFLHKSRDNLSLFRSINEEIVSASEVTGACTCQLGCLWERAEGESAISGPTNVLTRWDSQ